MKRKDVTIPMIVGVGLYCAVVLIDICVMLLQKAVLERYMAYEVDKIIMPTALFGHILTLALFAVFLCVIMLYNGSSRRIVSWVMLGVHLLLSGSALYSSMFINNFIYRMHDMNYIAAMNALNTSARMFTSPFAAAAMMCMLVAIGRYGITKSEETEETE